jgi:hypothetical protein
LRFIKIGMWDQSPILRSICMRVISDMKTFSYYSCVLVIAALVCAGLSGCETSGTAAPGATASVAAPAGQNAAQLIIRRSPNMGTGLFLDVSIDGANVGTVPMGQTYRGSLSPGQHVISVILRPNQLHLSPTKKTLTAVKGQTYDFTAMWQGQTVVLR